MTVAAVILAASPASALADAAGRVAVRRIAEAAWAGGAMPLVVVAPDPDGSVGAALSGSGAVLVAPAPSPGGPVAQIVHGIRAATELVVATEAALVWPARLVWVDAETVTMLIQAHGMDADAVLRPRWEETAGWPALVPLRHLAVLAALAVDRLPDELLDDLAATGIPLRTLDLGDPGAVLDGATSIDALPAYRGPAEPLSPPPDWGAAAAETADDAPPDDVRRLEPGSHG